MSMSPGQDRTAALLTSSQLGLPVQDQHRHHVMSLEPGVAHKPSPSLILTVDGCCGEGRVRLFWMDLQDAAVDRSTLLQWIAPHPCKPGQHQLASVGCKRKMTQGWKGKGGQ